MYVLLRYRTILPLLLALSVLPLSCKKENPEKTGSVIQLVRVRAGTTTLSLQDTTVNVPVDKNIIIEFSNQLDTGTVGQNIFLTQTDGSPVPSSVTYMDNYKTVVLIPSESLSYLTKYKLSIEAGLKGLSEETFPGISYWFTTINGKLSINSITLNASSFVSTSHLLNVDLKHIEIVADFSAPLNESDYSSSFTLSGGVSLNYSLSNDNKRVTITNAGKLEALKRYSFTISNNLTSSSGFTFDGFSNSFYTSVDSVYKFPEVSDEDLLDIIQRQTFKYFYDFGHPDCGLARERNTSGDVVTTGGSGFGVMALVVGMARGYISRTDGLERMDKILGFLETCDRYHGAWPHWINGSTGKTIPFSTNDDGGDLVETSFMVEGLLTMRQYLDSTVSSEKNLIDRINTLCNGVEYDWFTRGENVLYWHWSPNNGWAVNLKIQGYNETLITYVLAAASTTHPVSAEVYHQGYAKNGAIQNGSSYYGYVLPLGEAYGGPLFFTHYSFLGLNPHNLQDEYANYWEQNMNQSLINWAYCLDNPKKWAGYSSDAWGLTASDNPWGYSAHSPTNDLGVITPTAAVSSLPYTPEQSMKAIRYFYYLLGDKLWGDYGFYDAFDVTEGWWANSYISIDEGPIICMIENYRSGLLWNLFMSCPEVKKGLDKLGFTY